MTTPRTAPAIGSRVTFQGRTAYVCEVDGDAMRIADSPGSEYGLWVPTPSTCQWAGGRTVGAGC